MKPMLIVAMLLQAVIMLVLPYLSPRPIFFGVRTGSDFRRSEQGRKICTQYWVQVLMWAAVSLALLLGIGGIRDTALGLAALLPIVMSLAAFVRAYFQARPYVLQEPAVREAELAPQQGLPRWSWLALPPFLFPFAAMQYLRVHWDEIPARYPVHFNAHGEANRWVDKSERAVFAPLWFSLGMLLMFLLLFVAVLIGSRKSVRPSALPGIFVVAMYLIAFLFTAVGLLPVVQVPPAALIGVTMGFVAAAAVIGYRRNADPKAPVEATPDECWTLGSFYVNANDPAIFVQKRIGFGYTINLGNVWSYIVMGGFTLGMIALAMFLKWSQG
jgi:uncharacterized membrane protein